MITTTKTVARYTVTDGVLDYSVPFPLYEAGDVLVLWSAAGGKESALALTNDYSVEIFSDGSGGMVTLLAGRVPAGATLALVSNIPETQELDLSHTAEVDTESLERELDRQVQMIQQHRSELDLCIKLNVTDNRTPEEVADELFEARDRAETAAKKAAFSEDEAGKQAARAEDEADRAKAEADRAAQAAQTAELDAGALNVDATWTLGNAVAPGENIILPVIYWPGRAMLHLSYDGVELYRGAQYEETGEKDTLSSIVKALIPIPAGTVMHAWVIASNVARHVEEAEERAKAEADRAEREADRAKSEADRAADAVILGTQAENLEAVWTLDADIPASGTLALPLSYFAGRNMLHLSYDGVELYRGPQYEEIGERDELSSSVRMLIPLSRGTVMHAWAVASNVARNVEEAEERARAEADRAKQEANRAHDEAERAEKAANSAENEADRAETARNVAQNAAQEATEQADRADDAAIDAGKYRNDALDAAKCVAASLRSRSLASIQNQELLSRVPSGFFVINTDIVLPGTIQQPLTPVDSVEDIPNMDGFFLLVPPFENDCPPRPEEPEPPEKPDVPDWTLPCGRRVKI
jgi:hypothetical protein|nr:MAG TPA: tail fiber protein [Bacteriophage sp.]